MFDAGAYISRIGLAGQMDPCLKALRTLHRAHLYTVPFENLDIALGRKIVCDEDVFLRKIVERRRGGFCYEMNGAFAALLRQLGFDVTLLSARVPREDGSSSPEFDHMALRVEMDEPWLADVGFGESFLEPLRIQARGEQVQDGRKYRIVDEGGPLLVERAEQGGEWRPQYSFTLVPRRFEEFAAMCDYHQTSPESHFTRKSLCTMATPEGRVTVSDRRLILTGSGSREERELESEEAWHAALKGYFGVVLL